MKVSMSRISNENTVSSMQVVTVGGKLVGMRLSVIHR